MRKRLLFCLSLLAVCAFTAMVNAQAEVKTDYTDAIVNADLSTTDAWNAEGTKGISGGMVKVGSGSNFDFSQTITLPAGQYKMTATAVYRFGANEQAEYDAIQAGTETHLAKLYAETSVQKFEANVQNRYEGASDTDLAGEGAVQVNGKFVPNSSAAVQAWFNAGKYVNELVFDVVEEGQVKIGIVKTTAAEGGEYANIGAWTLTRLGDVVIPVTVESPWVGAAIESGKAYYLYNVKANAFMDAGLNWGTKAIFGNHGWAVIPEGTETYTLKMFNSNFYSKGEYVDGNEQQAAQFAITEVGDKIYTIKVGENYYGGEQGSDAVIVDIKEVDDRCYWQLVTEDERKAALAEASATNPINADFYVCSSVFSRNGNNGGWTGLSGLSGGGETYSIVEYYNTAAWAVKHNVVEGLPNGTYQLKVDAFYRHGNYDEASANRVNGTEELLAFLYANNDTVPVMSILDGAGKNGNVGVSTTFGSVPNSKADANAYFKKGIYSNSLYFTVTDGTLNIGVIKKEKAVARDWFAMDNVAISYYGTATVEEIELAKLKEYIDEVTALVAAAKAVEATYTEAAKAELDAAVVAGEAALAAPTKESLVAAVAPLEAAIARAERSSAINAVYGAATLNTPVAMTGFVCNPDMTDGTINGWTVSAGWQFQSNKVYTGEGAELNRFQEIWTNGVGLGNTSTMQALMDMPNGIYRVSADIMATAQYNEDPKGHTTGAYLVANNDSVAVATGNEVPEHYSVDVVVTDNVLNIGLAGVNTTANWIGLDNVTLAYYGVAPEAEWTDITAERMVNGDLSSEAGWTAAGVDDHGAESHKFLAFYAGWGSLEQPTAASLKQEVTLPAGEYRLTGKAFFRQGEGANDNPTTSLGYMVAGENKVLVPALGSDAAGASVGNFDTAADAFYNKNLYTCTLEFTLTEETTLSIGYECDFDLMRSWMGVGSMKLEKKYTLQTRFMEVKNDLDMLTNTCLSLYQLGGVQNRYNEVSEAAWTIASDIENASLVAMNELIPVMVDMIAEVKAIDTYFNEVFNEVKFNCYDIQDNSTAKIPEAAAAFEEVVSLSYNMSGISDLASLQALADTLEYARRQYVVNAVPAEGFSFDYTFLVEGAGDSAEGWVKDITGFTGNFVYKNSAEKDTETLKKTGFIEAWNPSAYKGSISYTANELPNGYYKVSAYAFTNGETSFFANDKSVAVEKTEKYVQPVVDSVMVTNGVLKFGLGVENANWVGITNIELSFVAAIPDSILYGEVRKAFVERAQEFGAFVEGNAALTMLNGIKGTYAWPLFDVIDPLVADIDNVTDMALLEEQIAAMDEATAVMEQAIAVYAEYSAIVDLFWTADENSKALNQDVADMKDMALQNSNYVGMMAATVEALEAAVVEIKAAYFAYVNNAVANEGFKFDATFMIVNPSFETGDLTGWEAQKANDTGVKLNSDGTYTMTGCDGEYVFNTWYGTGIYVQQTVKDLPAGVYALNVVVASDDILLEITAGSKTIQHTCSGGKGTGSDVAVDSIVHEGGDFLIKVATVNNDWFKADNFRLYALGAEKPVVEVESVALDQTEVTLTEAGATVQLVATVTPENATDATITWSSSDEAVATVVDGKVTAVANGTATITVTTANGKTATCVVTVNIADGIESIEAAENAVIYDILGRRVTTMEKGIYIVNGKKVLVK